jgi:AcrR family transcriptional regulator
MTAGASGGGSARDRILDTASELFYRDGYHAVGIDTIIAQSGVAKTTLYRHFASKDDLIAAYLERANTEFMSWLDEAIASVDDPRTRLIAMFEAVAKLATSTRCLGCTFQGAASEFPELDHPGHRVALDHKREVLERFTGLAREAGLRDPDALAAQLLLLMDGAWVAARMFGPQNHATSVAEAATAVIASHAAEPARSRSRPGRNRSGSRAAGKSTVRQTQS